MLQNKYKSIIPASEIQFTFLLFSEVDISTQESVQLLLNNVKIFSEFIAWINGIEPYVGWGLPTTWSLLSVLNNRYESSFNIKDETLSDNPIKIGKFLNEKSK